MVGGDAVSYSEFPHTTYSEHGHVELIRLYQQLTADYAGTLNEITAVNNRLLQYENDMNSRIVTIETVTVPNAVNRSVQEAMNGYMQDINKRFNDLQIRLSTVENMYDSIQSTIDQEVGGVRNDLELLRAEVQSIQNNLQGQITGFSKQVDQVNANMAAFISGIQAENTEFRKEIQQNINELDTNMSNRLQEAIDMLVDFQKLQREDYIMRDVLNLKDSIAYTDEKVSALHTLIESLNEFQFKEQIRWLWQYGCNFGGYNAIQWYNDTFISCEDWNKSNISCTDWYVRGREIFHWFDRQHFMFSPVSGRYVDTRIAILEIATAIKINGITAAEYDSAKYTGQEYNALELSASDYDWNGRRLITDV